MINRAFIFKNSILISLFISAIIILPTIPSKADGIIFGTPVYFINVSAQAKAIIDRTYAFLFNRKLKGKVAAVIAATRRVGGGQVLNLMYSFFSIHRRHISGGSIGYGLGKGDVKEGPGASPFLTAMEESAIIGKGVVKLVNQLSSGSNNA